MTQPPVTQEKTGWRDRELSLRHRVWGFDSPFVDVDWICLEYDHHKVMGLFDYKAENNWPPDQTKGERANLDALRDMADRGRVPFFVVRYRRPYQWFEPWCWSNVAHMGWAAYHKRRMTEAQYVTFLYELRTRKVPDEIMRRLSGAA